MAEQWFSIVEYARTFKVSDMTVRRRIKTGKLRAVLKEGKYFIPVPLNDGRQMPTEMPRGGMESNYQEQAVQRPTHARVNSRPANEMMIVKGHPSAHKTLSSVAQNLPPENRSFTNFQADGLFSDESIGDEGTIPASLRRPLLSAEASLVDTKALLAFCEASLKKFAEIERRQVEKFKSKLETLEATLAAKDLEIKQLHQQAEDLQLLIKVLERKKT